MSIEDRLGLTPAERGIINDSPQKAVFNPDKVEDEFREQANELSAFVNVERSQIIDACRQDLNFLAALAMPEVFQADFPPVLQLVWQMVVDMVLNEGREFPKLALGIPRGHAKTTLVKLLILYIILFTKRKYILVLSSIEKKAVAIISDVIDMLEEPNIVNTFGRWDAVKPDMDQQATKKFHFRGREIILYGTGALGDVRGTNLGNARPDVIIFEDVQTREAAESEVQSTAIENWMYSTVMKAKSPHGCVYLFVANMYPTKHSILKKLKDNPTWVKFIAGAILQDGTALWEEVHPISALLEELEHDTAAGKPEAFLAEVMNETNLAAFRKSIDITKIEVVDPTDPSYLVRARFIVIDPATGKRAEGLDDVGVGYFETSADNPTKPISRQLILAPMTPKQTIMVSLFICLKNNCRVIGVESNAYQQTFAFWFNEICRQLRIDNVYLIELYTNNMSKNARVDFAIKALVSKEVLTTPDTHAVIIKQATEYDFTKTKNKDEALDLVAFSTMICNNHRALTEAMSGAGLQLHSKEIELPPETETSPF